MHRRRTLFSANHFLFISLFALAVYIFDIQPTIALWVVCTLIILGAFFLIASLLWIGKYQNVFEYEPTQFLGRSTTGKQARDILRKGVLIGGGAVFIGLMLLLVTL